MENLVSGSNSRLPFYIILHVDLYSHWPVLVTFQSSSTYDVFGSCNGLVVVDVGGAVGAEVTVHGVSCIVFLFVLAGRNFKRFTIHRLWIVAGRRELGEVLVAKGVIKSGRAAYRNHQCRYSSLGCPW